MLAVPPDKELMYVTKDDRQLAPEKQSRFFYRPLPARENARLQNSLIEVRQNVDARRQVGESRTLVNQGTQELDVLVLTVVRAENLYLPDGSAVPPIPTKLDERRDWWTYVPAKYRSEIARAILGEQEVSEEEAKNSDSPSGSPSSGTETAGARAPEEKTLQ